MSDLSELEPTPTVYPVAESNSRVNNFLSQLIFKEHGLRLGLQITSVITAYTLCYEAIPWGSFGTTTHWQGLLSWFMACIGVTVFDRVYLSKSLNTYWESCRLDFVGAYDLALKKIRSISPSSGRLISCPKDAYHQLRTRIFLHAEEFERAEHELELARLAGIRDEEYYGLKLEIIGARSDSSAVLSSISDIRSSIGDCAWLSLEQGFAELRERKMREAKVTFSRIIKLSNETHRSGDLTSNLAEVFLQITRLWTGYAEEALEELDIAIAQYRALAFTVESLRPYVATILLERAYYLATHQEPVAAIADVRTALAFCAYPQHLNLATKVKDELEWRFPEALTPKAQVSEGESIFPQ